VTLKAGKYKVTGSGPSGYNIAYSSECSGAASGGVPIKCTISPSFSKTTTKSKYPGPGILLVLIMKASCSVTVIKEVLCPDIGNHKIRVSFQGSIVKEFTPQPSPTREDHIFIPAPERGGDFHITSGVWAPLFPPYAPGGPWFSFQETQFIIIGKGLCGIDDGSAIKMNGLGCHFILPGATPSNPSPQMTVEVDNYYRCLKPVC
jgi:hypothetical protein